MENIFIFLLSLGVSGFGTLIGFGGGIFMIPILVLFFNIDMTAAIGAVSLSLVPATAIASLFNAKKGLIHYSTAFWLEISTVLGAILGAYLTSQIPIHKLEVLFGIFLIIVSIKLMKTSQEGNPSKLMSHLNTVGPKLKSFKGERNYNISFVAASFFGMIAGLIAGLFGVGGGFLKTPMMVYVFKIPAKIASATALFMILFTSITASFSHYQLGHIQAELTYIVFTGFCIGAIVGNIFKSKISNAKTKKLIILGLMAAGISIMIHSFL